MNSSSNDDLFYAKIQDLFNISYNKSIIKTSLFFDERQVYIAKQYCSRINQNYIFDGGYTGAVRQILIVYPDYVDANDIISPIVPITISFNSKFELSHRDILGALMSLNIKREMIGDILIDKGYAVVFAHNNVKDIIINDLNKIAKIGVNTSLDVPDKLPDNQKFKEITGTVSSLRLDAVISLATGLSREKSSNLVKSKFVTVNYNEQTSLSKQMQANDIFSIKGYGKFKICDEFSKTKKERIFIKIKKYL